MIRCLKNKIIHFLGGHSFSSYQQFHLRIKEIESERDLYRDFVESVSIYVGSYPAWKAQAEYREYLSEIGRPLSVDKAEPYPTKAENVDRFLGRVVDGFFLIMNHRSAYMRLRLPSSGLWRKERLSQARGDHFLVTLSKRKK